MTQTICNVCIMDTTDHDIVFHGAEGCNHCIHARARIANEAFSGALADHKLQDLVARIKESGKGKPYDCAVGISGGVDSSYVLDRAVKLGLRPLAIHVDNGWNSELAVANIQKIVNKLGVDLHSVVIDWAETKALQRACFAAPVMDIEIVADHAIFAGTFHTAARYGIRYFLSGLNIRTESILPKSWATDKRDARQLHAIYKKFGDGTKLRTYPTLSPFMFLYYILVRRMRYIPILNYGDYNKAEAISYLQTTYDWTPYPNKHGESTFTSFFQDYYLPAKFGIDKRKAHLSSLIVSGAITRDAALEAMKKPLFEPAELRVEKDYILKKLGYTADEFDHIMQAPHIRHEDLPNNGWMFTLKNPVTRFIRHLAKDEIIFTSEKDASYASSCK